eukprot:982655_1
MSMKEAKLCEKEREYQGRLSTVWHGLNGTKDYVRDQDFTMDFGHRMNQDFIDRESTQYSNYYSNIDRIIQLHSAQQIRLDNDTDEDEEKKSPVSSPSTANHPPFRPTPPPVIVPPLPQTNHQTSQQLYDEYCSRFITTTPPPAALIHTHPARPPIVTQSIILRPPPPLIIPPPSIAPPPLHGDADTSQQLYEEFCEEISLNLNPKNTDDTPQIYCHMHPVSPPTVMENTFTPPLPPMLPPTIPAPPTPDNPASSQPPPPTEPPMSIDDFNLWVINFGDQLDQKTQEIQSTLNASQPLDIVSNTSHLNDDDLNESLIGRVTQQLSDWAHATHCLVQTPIKEKEIINKQNKDDAD